MAKIKEMTPEMAMRHNLRLNVAVLNHAAYLKDTLKALKKNDTKGAVWILGVAVRSLERVCLTNAKEIGYKQPKKFRMKGGR